MVKEKPLTLPKAGLGANVAGKAETRLGRGLGRNGRRWVPGDQISGLRLPVSPCACRPHPTAQLKSFTRPFVPSEAFHSGARARPSEEEQGGRQAGSIRVGVKAGARQAGSLEGLPPEQQERLRQWEGEIYQGSRFIIHEPAATTPI